MTLKRLVIGLWIAVLLAMAIEIVIPYCNSLECRACADWLDATLCAMATGG